MEGGKDGWKGWMDRGWDAYHFTWNPCNWSEGLLCAGVGWKGALLEDSNCMRRLNVGFMARIYKDTWYKRGSSELNGKFSIFSTCLLSCFV